MRTGCLTVLTATLLSAISAQGYTVGYTNLNLAREGVRTSINTTGMGIWPNGAGDTQTDGLDMGGLWAGPSNANETSWTVDWHSLTPPSRTVKKVVLLPTGRTPKNFVFWKGTWNGSSMDWTQAFATNAYAGSDFKPMFFDVAIPNASAFKYQVYETSDPNYREMNDILLFGEDRRSPQALVVPDGAFQTEDATYTNCISAATLAMMRNDIKDNVSGYDNTGVQRSVKITFTFNPPKHLSGIAFNIGPLHALIYYWKTWEVRSLEGDLLGTSFHGPAGDPEATGNAYRTQLIQFAGDPSDVTGFVLQGWFGDADVDHVLHNAYVGDVWGITARRPTGTVIVVR